MSFAPKPRQPAPNTAPRRLLAASLLVALLLLAHAAIMATARHATVMGTAHAMQTGMVTALAMVGEAQQDASGAGDPQTPAALSDCPAQRAVLPLRVFLLALLVARSIRDSPFAAQRARQVSAAPLPPPRPPRQRRADLQVFRI